MIKMRKLILQIVFGAGSFIASGQQIPERLTQDFQQAKKIDDYQLYSKAKEELIVLLKSGKLTEEDMHVCYRIAQEFRDVKFFLYIESLDTDHKHSNCSKHNTSH